MPSKISIDSRTNALIAARAALDKQAEHIVVMDVRALSSVTDFFVLCTAGSARQIEAIKEHVEDVLEQHGSPVWHTEGVATSSLGVSRAPSAPQWVLMDFGDFVVHLLDQPTRAFYRLEELWADAPRVPINFAPRN